ncbi:MAG TPA: ubiquinol-cytochrome c reductase iron-sulfur subunit [Anaerolineales bacterium]|nr:ubiquinol-cytochrome c reductase iron-sulfur subunit [Anaerolineales bacterium]
MAEKVKSPNMSRRDFTKIVTGFLGGLMGVTLGIPIVGYAVGPALKSDESDDWISLGALDEYPVGIPTSFTFNLTKVNGWERTTNSYGVFVLRESESEVKVLSNICTHLSCRVTWQEEEETYHCPCHDALFAKNGDVLSGPPPRPLDTYPHKVEDGILYITPNREEA